MRSVQTLHSKRLRIAVAIVVALVILIGAARLWTAGPDGVHVVVTQHTGGDAGTPARAIVIYNRTIHDPALAQWLQRDVAALDLVNPLATYSCGVGTYTYTSYSLQWSRAGLVTETATNDATGCSTWTEDGIIRRVLTSNAIYTDMAAALGTPVPVNA